jgi:hypothetical protein
MTGGEAAAFGELDDESLTPDVFSGDSEVLGRGGAGAGGQGAMESDLAATDGDDGAAVVTSAGMTSGGIGAEGISATGAAAVPEGDSGSRGEAPRVVVAISAPGWFRMISRTHRSPGPLTVAPPANEAATSTMANNPLRNVGPPCQRDAKPAQPLIVPCGTSLE